MATLKTLLSRPNLTIADSRAIEDQATLLQTVDVQLGGRPRVGEERVFIRIRAETNHRFWHD